MSDGFLTEVTCVCEINMISLLLLLISFLLVASDGAFVQPEFIPSPHGDPITGRQNL